MIKIYHLTAIHNEEHFDYVLDYLKKQGYDSILEYSRISRTYGKGTPQLALFWCEDGKFENVVWGHTNYEDGKRYIRKDIKMTALPEDMFEL